MGAELKHAAAGKEVMGLLSPKTAERSVERTYDFVAMVLAILRWHALRSGNVIPNQGDRCY